METSRVDGVDAAARTLLLLHHLRVERGFPPVHLLVRRFEEVALLLLVGIGFDVFLELLLVVVTFFQAPGGLSRFLDADLQL